MSYDTHHHQQPPPPPPSPAVALPPLPPALPTDWTPTRDTFISGGVIAVFVLGGLCLLLGAIYAYIYFTRINPRSSRIIRKYMERGPRGGGGEDGSQATSTHLFLFKK